MMTTITDADRAAHLRDAERHIRAARKELLAAQLPPEQWAVTRHDVHVLNEIALSCMDFAESWEWREYDASRRREVMPNDANELHSS